MADDIFCHIWKKEGSFRQAPTDLRRSGQDMAFLDISNVAFVIPQ